MVVRALSFIRSSDVLVSARSSFVRSLVHSSRHSGRSRVATNKQRNGRPLITEHTSTCLGGASSKHASLSTFAELNEHHTSSLCAYAYARVCCLCTVHGRNDCHHRRDGEPLPTPGQSPLAEAVVVRLTVAPRTPAEGPPANESTVGKCVQCRCRCRRR